MDGLKELEMLLGTNLSLMARTELAAGAIYRAYTKGDIIIQEESPAMHLHLILKGVAKSKVINQSGADTVLNLITQGEAFGLEILEEGRANISSVVAIKTTETICFSSELIRYLVREDSSISRWTTNLLIEKIAHSSRRIADLHNKPAIARISCWLLSLDKEFEKKGIDILRSDLAGLLGTTRETASRYLSELRKRGLIRSQNNLIFIVDQKGLEVISNQKLG